MQLYIIVTFVGHMARVLAVDAFGPTISTHHGNGFNISHLPVPSTNGTLLPGYHRNVSAGAAWVLPASRTDLGARAMSCECFDPDASCCMPSSSDVAPFCIPKEATCCGDTLCISGETCCGGYCCRSETTCSTDPKVPGCCPKDQLCNNQVTPVCLNSSSPNCMNNTSPPKQCCPLGIPYCQAHPSLGFGCFGAPASSKPKSRSSTASKTYNGTTTIVETVSINIVSTGLSIQFPGTITLASNLAGWSIATTYVFSFPSTIFEGEPSSSTTPSTTSLPAFSRPSSTTSTQRSTLCFDPDLQSPVPCTTSPSDPSSSSAPAIYPAATTLHSSAQRTVSALNLYCILSYLALLYLIVHVDFFIRSSVLFLSLMNRVLQLSWTQLQDHHHNGEGNGGKEYAMEAHNAVKRVNEVVHYAVVVVPATVGLETVRRIERDYWVS